MEISFQNKKFDSVIAVAVAVLVIITGIAVSLNAYTYVILILGAALGAVGLIVLYNRPALGAALIMGLAPLEGALDFRGNSAVKLATLVVGGILILKIIVNKKKIVFDLTASLILVFLGWAFITILWSPDQSASLSSWISFALQGILYFLLINLVSSESDLKLALWGHVLGGMILAIGVTNVMVGRDFLRSGDVLGLGINMSSRLMGLSLVMAFLLYQLEKHALGKIVLFAAIVSTGVGVVVTLSRATWLALVLCLILVGFLAAFTRKFTLPIGQMLVWTLAGMAVFYMLTNYLLDQHAYEKLSLRFQSAVSLSDAGGDRFWIWQVGLLIFEDAPFFGHGFDSFKHEFASHIESSALTGKFRVGEIKNAHNSYVLAITELGLIGLTLFLLTLFSVFDKGRLLLEEKRIKTFAFFLIIFVFLLVATGVDSALDRKYLWYTLSMLTLIARYFWTTDSEDLAVESLDTE